VSEPLEFLVRHGYLLLFGVVLGEQLGLPLVGAPVLLAAGALAATGRFALSLVLLLPVLACLVGDGVWYTLGRRRGASVLGLLCRISLEPDSCVRRTEDTFARHGIRVLLVAKFLPGLNNVAPPLSGVTRMPFGRFLAWDAAGAGLWVLAYVGLGYALSAQLALVTASLAQLGRGAGALGAVGVGLYVAWKYVQRWRFLRSLRVARIEPAELRRRVEAGEALLVVDLRSEIRTQDGGHRIPGALLLHPDELERRHSEIPRDREVILYCS
jgi:membrane protein DedA with SNARE-associated domain